jgi:hypothetical protein
MPTNYSRSICGINILHFLFAAILAVSTSPESAPPAKLTCREVTQPGSTPRIHFQLENTTDNEIKFELTGFTGCYIVDAKTDDGKWESKEWNWCGTLSPRKPVTVPPKKTVTWTCDAVRLRKYGRELRFSVFVSADKPRYFLANSEPVTLTDSPNPNKSKAATDQDF